jgi:hypothetical protein
VGLGGAVLQRLRAKIGRHAQAMSIIAQCGTWALNLDAFEER